MLSRLKYAMLAASSALLIVGGIGGATVSAQEAAECVSPGLPPGTPTPMDEMAEEMDMASPEAMEMPAAPEMPVGTPAEGDVLAALDAAATNYVACLAEGWSTGDPSLYVALETENMWGSPNPWDRVASESEGGFSSVELRGLSNQQVYEDGRASVNINALVGDHWLANIRAFFVEQDGAWLYDEEAFEQADTSFADSVTVVGINIVEETDEASGAVTYAFQFLGSPTLTETEVTTLNFSNQGAEAHEAILVQLPEGADPLGLLDGSVAFEDVSILGIAVPIFPGQTVEMSLLALDPGTYTLVCFFPGPDGAPHIVNGMVAQFDVVAAAA
ncbi:MAG: hypothetical protein IT335_06925 [Thermomicrobiales bacterium]|jgi:uncharacterized cupredoxin-like copper-binding protein|nr:hypothetical protein [Thermomicrobiales bacterium]